MKKIFFGLILSVCILSVTNAQDAAILITPIERNTWQRFAEHLENMAKFAEQIEATYKTIENQYQQYKHMVEQAKSIDWSKYDLSNFKIDKFTNPAEAIKAQLNLINDIKNQMNSNIMSVNGHSYSIADMVGLNGKEHNLEQFFIDGVTEAQRKKNSFVKALTANLSQKERDWIQEKFGVNAELYAVRKAQEEALKNKIGEVITNSNELTDDKKREYFERLNKILEEVLDDKNDVNPTKLLQVIVMQNQVAKELWQTIDRDINLASEMHAKNMLMEQSREAYSKGMRRNADTIKTITTDAEKVVRKLRDVDGQ